MKRFSPFLTKTLAFAIAIFLSTGLAAQIQVTPAGVGAFTPENLITNIFLGQGVEVTGLTYEGEEAAVGYFTDGQADMGIDRGIVMSSGFAATAATDNNSGSTSGNTSGTSISDPDLSQIANAGIQDVAIYTITFIPINDTLRFRFVFASEEYPEFACTNFNDAFGFFISGPGINGAFTNNGENIALVPDPADPTGLTFTNVPVTINNVNDAGLNPGAGCNFDFATYYNDNSGSTTFTYDGFLDVFTAQAIVTPCEEYTIKLAICDRSDDIYDSAVFLEAKSFGTGALQTEVLTTSLDFTVAEGCDEGFFEISLPNPADEPIVLDYTILGDASPGVDYQAIPSDLVLAAGDTNIIIPVVAFEDDLVEGIEQVCLDIQLDTCNRDTFCINIRDKLIQKPDLGADTIICAGSTIPLDAELNIPLPPPPNFTSNQSVVIDPVDEAVFSDINVTGVLPGILQEGVVKQVCIDTLIHPWVDDLDIFLIAPGGQFVELTTDNGADGNNYIGTCFTLDATLPINAPEPFAPADSTPFTGNYQPEGVWSDLWDGENPTNGTWRLQIVDDANGFTGTINQWSICFEPIYQLDYEWEPAPGLSCYDCPNPLASPDTTTTYIVKVTDSYGCETRDTITVDINNDQAPNIDQLDVTPASCVGLADGEISVQAGGPNPPFTYILAGVETNTTGLFDSLPPDVYELQVLGSTGCVQTLPVEVAPADTLFLDLNLLQAVSCDMGNDGVLQAGVSGGTPGYTFLWSGGETTDTLTNVGAGDYLITVTDAQGCQAVDSLTIGDPTSVNLLFDVENVECFQTATGSVTAVVVGGSGNYAYQWDAAAGAQTDATATGLVAGTYSVTVTDDNGCTAVDSTSIQEAAFIQMVVTPVAVSCFDASDGLASATALGGAGGFTYQWSNGVSGSLQTGLAGGTYIVTATDINGCQIIDTAVVPQPDSLIVFDLVVDSTSCFNTLDGGVSFSVTGGTPNPDPGSDYSYIWSDGGPSDSLRNDLAPGTYTVTVQDVRGCEQEQSFEILAPDSISLQVLSQNASCAGIADGVAEALASGGSGGFTYAWSAGLANGNLVSDLTNGSYSVTVTDANACTAEEIFTIQTPDSLVLDLNTQDVSCNGFSDGAASLNVSGGSPGYTITWSDGQSGPDAQNLPGGSYTVAVIDQEGCTDTLALDIAEPPALTNDFLVENVNCNGESDGSLQAQGSGGAGALSYSWSTGAAGPDLSDLPAGIYILTLTDINNCELLDTAQITEPASLSLLLDDAQDVDCNGEATGALSVTAGGGVGGYIYTWSGGPGDTPNPTGLTAGNYSLTVTDLNGCTISDTYPITEPDALLVELEPNGIADIECSGESSGSIAVEVSGGTAPYAYLWSNTANTEDIADLSAGSYVLTVTDNNGCSTESQYLLTEPQPLELQVNSADVNCFGGADGGIDLEVSGGVDPYTYAWSLNGNFFSNSEDLSALEAGTYSLLLEDANGCTADTVLTINQPADPVMIAFAPIDSICFGATNGEVSASVSGGTGPYTFSWDNGQSGSTATSLPAGPLGLTVTDAGGCEYTASALVEAYGQITAATSATPALCHDGNDGSAEVTGVFYDGQAAPADAFSYVWNTTPPQSGLQAGNLQAGQTYTVTITNAAGCSTIASQSISNPSPVEVAVQEIVDASCNGGADGEITLAATGGAGSYTFAWDAAAGNQTTATAIALAPGAYSVTVTDANGCTAVTGAAIAEPSTMEVVSWAVTDVRCFGGADGSLQVTISGGNPPYFYDWSNGGDGQIIQDLPAGLYELTITDQSGCTLLATQEVEQPAEGVDATAQGQNISCFGFEDGSISILASGGTPPYRYSLDGQNFSGANIFSNLRAGVYDQLAVEDANGCVFPAGTVTIVEPPALEVDLGPDQEILFGDSLQILPDILNAQGAVTFRWQANDSLRCIGTDTVCLEPWVRPEYRGEYELTVIDANGCRASDLLVIDVLLEKGFYVPTGFTPNGDGQNDVMRTHGREGIEVLVFRVYDRWGELLYEQGGFGAESGIGWDGRFKGEEMPTGIYVWYAEVEYPNGRRELFKGETQLVR